MIILHSFDDMGHIPHSQGFLVSSVGYSQILFFHYLPWILNKVFVYFSSLAGIYAVSAMYKALC